MTDKRYNATLVSPDACCQLWKAVKPLLIPAIEASNGRWKQEYVLAALVAGRQSLWVIAYDETIVGAATTEVVKYPEKTALAIHFLGGADFSEWYTLLLKTLTDFAEQTGCDMIECNARFGFWKWFKTDGFTKPSSFYEKLL